MIEPHVANAMARSRPRKTALINDNADGRIVEAAAPCTMRAVMIAGTDGAKAIATLAKGNPIAAFRNRYRDSGGQYRWLQWKAKSIPEDNIVFAVARVLDNSADADSADVFDQSCRENQD